MLPSKISSLFKIIPCPSFLEQIQNLHSYVWLDLYDSLIWMSFQVYIFFKNITNPFYYKNVLLKF